MNAIMTEYYPTFEMYQALRDQLMQMLTDEDLRYTPGGANPALGELCRQIGETEYSYIQSFKTFAQDFSYRNTSAGLAESVQQLAAWYAALDQELRETIAGLSDEAIANRMIDRGSHQLPSQMHLSIYQEALLIFYGKANVYLNAIGKQLPQQWQEWIE